jgi:hypothetical protein
MFDDDENIDAASEIVAGEFGVVQQALDGFVEINYKTAKSVEENIPTPEYIANLKGKILDIIRNNPPLASVPKYFHEGRKDYLWYSDFYDNISKDNFRKYRKFVKPVNEITVTNYAEELAKIDMPYFKELVNLISLERLFADNEKRIPKEIEEIKPISLLLPIEETPTPKSIEPEIIVKPESKPELLSKKRSYEPKLNDKQYLMLVECIETIELFRSPIKVTKLKKLLEGKLTEPLQVSNQKSLVYLFDLLSESKYIKEAWMYVAAKNRDFISFRNEGNKQRYGDEIHYISMQQFQNSRTHNKSQAIKGLADIEDTVEDLDKYREK